ncbi:MAG TPA: TonB-dependent receptor [Pyrinomonadaceae bacterium]|jgi:outer membrane receptor protein involved in Fe transport
MKTILQILTVFVFALGLAIIPATAQTSTTGNIEGTVTDPSGAVVPGASVTVSGGNLVRAITVTANDEGFFRVGNVPPGRYSVKVEAAGKGFATYENQNIEVNLSRTTTVDTQLTPASTGATVDVVAGSEIDTTQNTSGTNVSTEQFSNFPTQRTVQSLYTIAPTVTRSGLRDASGRDRDPSVAGSSGPENNYILDGVNTTDPAFGGSGANLPFEFVQEVEVKTGSYGAEYGLSTGGIFNVITKSGTNEFRGEVYGYFTGKSMVRDARNFSFTGLSPSGFSEIDAGFGIGGPIIKDKLTFYGSFNPQYRNNSYLTQTFRTEVENKIATPFYAGKLTWSINDTNTFNFSTFGDFTKEEGHLFAGSGFGANLNSFEGIRETGGSNYAFRLNSTFSQNFIGEFSFGMHFQRNNVIPGSDVLDTPLVTDNFAVLRANGTVAPVVQTGVLAGGTVATPGTNTGFVDFVYSPGGSLQRNFIRQGFGLYQDQTRNRYEAAARLQSIFGRHTLKYGFEYYRNIYDINQTSTGPSNVFANPLNVPPLNQTDAANRNVSGFRVTNNFSVCTVRGAQVVCPSATATNILTPAITANQVPGITSVITGTITPQEALNNPFLVRTTTRVRDFKLIADTKTDVESFYVQDDIKVSNTIQLNIGARWDFQQAYGNGGVEYLKLNNFWHNLQPRIGFIWDFTGKGKGKVFANYARYLETPIPLDLNVRAGSGDAQTDKNFNVNTLNAPLNATVATGFGTRNLGHDATPIDADLKPQTVNEWNVGIEYEAMKDLVLGFRGIYRPQGTVIEDGSFDDGTTYFIFNPGESTTEQLACDNGQCFGRARRFYRALEFTATRRFNNNFSFIASYVFSSLTGNYEGLFRNDNGQSDPNITSLFDLTSLLNNTYGRLPNDRPHQFKFNGTYVTPWRVVLSGNFYLQSGAPFNALVPHPVYGNNEGFLNPRGTTIVPTPIAGGEGGLGNAVGTSRTPTTFNLDLGVYFPIKFGEKRELRFTADWFNVTNTQRAVKLDETFLINSGVTGVAPVANPFFGTGQIFQYPSSLRLGAKFRF